MVTKDRWSNVVLFLNALKPVCFDVTKDLTNRLFYHWLIIFSLLLSIVDII